jgi:hypothetical protein
MVHVPPPPEKHFRLTEPFDDAVDCIIVPALGSDEPLPPPEQALAKIIPLTARNARRREGMISHGPRSSYRRTFGRFATKSTE